MSQKILKNAMKLRHYYTVSSNNITKKHAEMQKSLTKQLQVKIKVNGALTVAEYMREVLTNPAAGYYMHNDVFGNAGDFVTSPELGQMFGEMVAIWFINEWKKLGSPKPFQIVELGPGRGSLCQDMIRVFKHLNELTEASVHLVEVSPFLCDMQARKLCLTSEPNVSDTSLCYRRGLTSTGMPIYWYHKLEDVPRQFSLYLAHEFFDALPIQKFQRTDQGWREILIDVDEKDENKFRFVMSTTETVGSKLLISQNESRNHLEISKESISIVKHLAERIEEDGGIALIADYGHDGEGTDTFRAFKQHKLHDPLVDPGSADLTADVDFKLLKAVAECDGRTVGFGPIPQNQFLKEMGIELRVQELLKNATPEQEKALKFALEMMTDDDKMGKRFKLLAIFPEVVKDYLKKFPVIGFN